MIAVITGDIINSRSLPSTWLQTLKDVLTNLPSPAKWELFRGDSFQVELAVEDALLNAFYIKASLKTIKNGDVRMSIGIGKKAKNNAEKLTEASGEAYINSGEAFDTLSVAKTNLLVKSPNAEFDDDINLYLKLALIAMDDWTPKAAEAVKLSIENDNEKQEKIAQISGKSQSSISEALKRAHFSEILELEKKYRQMVIENF
jgi:hypothetical protein